ncbi:hypothetical protein FSJ48_022840, partial [Escherichia coli]|nr:hypothetical protein [Escherichia coli]
MTVTDGGVVKTAGVTLGNTAGSSGTIDVSSGASWDNGMQILTVGNNSAGTVNIHDGGTITTGAALLGKSATGDGTLNVDGAGSILNLVNGNTYISVLRSQMARSSAGRCSS